MYITITFTKKEQIKAEFFNIPEPVVHLFSVKFECYSIALASNLFETQFNRTVYFVFNKFLNIRCLGMYSLLKKNNHSAHFFFFKNKLITLKTLRTWFSTNICHYFSLIPLPVIASPDLSKPRIAHFLYRTILTMLFTWDRPTEWTDTMRDGWCYRRLVPQRAARFFVCCVRYAVPGYGLTFMFPVFGTTFGRKKIHREKEFVLFSVRFPNNRYLLAGLGFDCVIFFFL